MPSGENGCGMGETNSSRQPSFESDLHAVDGGQRRFLRLTLSDSWIGVRVVYVTGLENQRCIRVRGFESYPIRHQQSDTLCTRLLFTYLRFFSSYQNRFFSDRSLSDSVAICEHYVKHGCTQYTFQGKMWYNAYRATGKTKYQKSSALHIVSLMWGLTPHSKKEK